MHFQKEVTDRHIMKYILKYRQWFEFRDLKQWSRWHTVGKSERGFTTSIYEQGHKFISMEDVIKAKEKIQSFSSETRIEFSVTEIT